jgi:starch synthase
MFAILAPAMDILFVTPSLLPLHVESGPAEACSTLSKALRSLGHRVAIAAPFPDEPDAALTGLARRLDPLTFEVRGQKESVHVYDGRSAGGVEWILFEHAALKELFEDGEAALFAQLVLARSVTTLLGRDHSYGAVHAHGEETALACALVALEPRLPTVMTLYSLARPLSFSAEVGHALGLDALVLDNRLCPLLSAVACARRVTTNAPARMLSSVHEEGEGELARALLSRGRDLASVIGGIDASIWNPLTDAHLVARYAPIDLTGKARNKAMLQHELKLEVDPDVPLLGAIEGEIGAERLSRIASELIRTDVQLVIQVLDEDAESIDTLIGLSERMPHRLQVRIGDSQMRAHRILSASDALLVAADRPVLAMAAQRYGTVPVARRFSLSAESIVDIDTKLETGTGILYDDRSPEALLAGARRAVAAFNRGTPFEAMRARLMRIDHSWDRAARAVEHVYFAAAEIQAA